MQTKKSIAFFNNKGGVGKTTLACNFAAYAAAQGISVAIVDLDPQCNATQLLLSDEQWEALFEDRSRAESLTVLHALSHIRLGDSDTVTDLSSMESERFGVHVIPGHPSLAVVEDKLSSSWSEFERKDLGGARRTCWARNLIRSLNTSFDLVIIDVGPSLGALNRCALIAADTFITPISSDLFSLYALENIALWLSDWLVTYRDAYDGVARKMPADLAKFPEITRQLPLTRGYLGYTTQQYVTKTSAGERRKTQAYEHFREQVPESIESLTAMGVVREPDLDLGIIPNMFSMVPLAQAAHAPVSALTKEDGLRGAQFSQQEKYVDELNRVFAKILDRASR
ncbi:ParA family protein [Nannocystis pusilla]|uniref:AAA family ATPase n=1 Tax=Nannocystis pusilla TaxID=889268 RepID=A0ABS7TM72_9BACT|nr:AAA family ATPase [Nannocystis pusilla]MBZ5709319.1 AAA family ATPase [Nannocystis pusilla]